MSGVLAAVGLRLVFWLYTGRVWEDALISLTPARNVWEGFGLTHHASEPRVHSFTSPLGEFILIAGESVRQGLLMMRLTSLVASASAIYIAYRIGLLLRFHWSAHLLVLGYLASDYLQIFFGMSGVETQVATALILANTYFYLTSQWWKLGLALGAAVICRPEFLLWGVIVGATVLVFYRDAILRVAIPSILIAASWFLFATVYYGTPVPHTIVVKSFFSQIDPHASLLYAMEWWKHVAPFRQFWFVSSAPLPDALLKLVVTCVVLLASVGAVWSIKLVPRMSVVVLTFVGFVVYRTLYAVEPYFMWYLPPFMAICFLLSGAGVSWIAQQSAVSATGISLAVLMPYAMQLPFTLPLDRMVQSKIEDDVRIKVGKELNSLMGPADTAVLEPLGFIGWEARNKSIYDCPGLGSPKAFAAFKQAARRHAGCDHTMIGMVKVLNPTFVVLRPIELAEFTKKMPDFTNEYEAISSIDTEPGLRIARWGLSYMSIDMHFQIFMHRQ